MTGEICTWTVEELARRLRDGAVSPVDATRAVLERIAELNPRVNAFTTLCPDAALAAARTAESEIRRGGYRGPLHGIPVGVKDLYDTAGVRTTYGSGIFRTHVPAADAAVVSRLRAAGAVIVGKTATHELGLGLTTNNFFFGPTRNPWHLAHVPGGSSGGSAAAIAADMCTASVGSDGGGSIRFPAAWCGVVGIKPTLGLLSNRGQFGAAGSSFSVPGPLCKTLRDAAIVLQVLAGFDPDYPWSVDAPAPDYLAACGGSIGGLRIGVSDDFFTGPIDPDVGAAYDAVLRRLEACGARITALRFPHHALVLPTLFVAMGGEMAAFIRGAGRVEELELSPEARPLVEMGARLTIDDFTAAQMNRELLKRDYRAAWGQADVIVLPSAPIPAPRIGEDTLAIDGTSHSVAQLCAGYTAAANLTGLPAVAAPAGFSARGLPIGVQVLAPHFEEARALRVAAALLDGGPALRRVADPAGG